MKALKLRPDIRQYLWGPLLVLLVGLAATGAVAWQLWRMADAKDRDRFELHVGQTQQNLKDRIESYAALLRDTAVLFAADSRPQRQDFRAHVQQLDRRKQVATAPALSQSAPVQYPGLLGLTWIGRDPSSGTVLKRAPRVRGGTRAPVNRFSLRGDKAARFAVTFMEPAQWRNRAIAGYDVFDNAASRAAMAESRDRGEMTASGRIAIAQEFWVNARNSFHLFLPVYRGGRIPTGVAERRQRLLGFLAVSVHSDDLLAGIHPASAYREISLEVYDGAQPQASAQIFKSDNAPLVLESGQAARMATNAIVEVAGRPWVLVFTTRPEFELSSDRRLVPTVLLIGALISLLLASANLFQSRARSALNASEVRYRRLFEASPDGVFLFDAQTGLLTDANPYMSELLGQGREQLIGRPLWEMGLFEDPEMARSAFNELREKDYYRYEQLPVTTPDGHRWYVDFTCNAYVTNGRRVMQCNVRNITDRKAAEDALRDSEERYRTLVEVSPQGVWIATRDGGLLYINQYWIEYSGMSLERSAGSGWTEQVHPEDRERMRDTWAHALPGGAMFETELRLKRFADGEYRWHLARGIPLRDSGGRIERWLGVFVDIHQRQQTEQERTELLAREQALRGEAEAANRAKDEFLATLSHELRTPLNAILGWTQTLRSGDPGRQMVMRALAQIEASANSQARLINDLLNVADIGAGRLRLEIQPVALIPLIGTVIESLRPAMQAREITFEAQYDADADEIRGDPSRLQQVVWNLLSNAVKFTPRQGHVSLKLRRLDSQIELSVEDDGEGISAEFLPFVFDRFRQADSSIKRRHGGLGLGLAIVRHLAELHGGSVSAHSEGEGHGARFVVLLPLRAAPPEAATDNALPEHAQADAAAGKSPPRMPPGQLQGLRLLSVDDDPSTREMLHQALELAGAAVTSAGSAREALEALQSAPPDVLVSDIGLPEEDGYDLIRMVRALPGAAMAATPAIALTGYARPQDQQAVLEAGYEAFLAKPVNLNDLVKTIRTLAGK